MEPCPGTWFPHCRVGYFFLVNSGFLDPYRWLLLIIEFTCSNVVTFRYVKLPGGKPPIVLPSLQGESRHPGCGFTAGASALELRKTLVSLVMSWPRAKHIPQKRWNTCLSKLDWVKIPSTAPPKKIELAKVWNGNSEIMVASGHGRTPIGGFIKWGYPQFSPMLFSDLP